MTALTLPKPPLNWSQVWQIRLNQAHEVSDLGNRKKGTDVIIEPGAKLILSSPNGTKYVVTVLDGGTLFAPVEDSSVTDFNAVQNSVNAVVAAGGGTVLLQPGRTYNMGAGTLAINGPNVTIDGGNRDTTLVFSNATADNVRLGNFSGLPGHSNVWLKHLTIQDSATRTAGFGVQLFGASQPGLEDVVINVTGANVAFWAHAFNDAIVRDCRFYGGVIISDAADGSSLSDVMTFDHVLIQPNTPMVGLHWDGNVHTVRSFGLTILAPTIGVNITNDAHSTSFFPEFGEFYDLEIDGAKQQAVWIQGGVIYKFIGLEINNNQSTSDATPTFQIDPDTSFSGTRAIQITGGYIANAWGRGLVINGRDIEITGIAVWGCGVGADNTYPAVEIGGISSRVSITGSRLGYASGQPNRSSYGVHIQAGTTGPIMLSGNNYDGNGTGSVLDGTGIAVIDRSVNNVGGPL
jgi:hypothetical protein